MNVRIGSRRDADCRQEWMEGTCVEACRDQDHAASQNVFLPTHGPDLQGWFGRGCATARPTPQVAAGVKTNNDIDVLKIAKVHQNQRTETLPTGSEDGRSLSPCSRTRCEHQTEIPMCVLPHPTWRQWDSTIDVNGPSTHQEEQGRGRCVGESALSSGECRHIAMP